MGFKTFLEKWFPTRERIGPDTITIEVPSELYYKELALYTGINLIANAIAKCEIETYEGGKAARSDDYYLLNVSPNPNQTSSQFWHDVIDKVVRRREGAYAVEYRQHIYCVDYCPVETQDSIRGHRYNNVSVGEYTFPKRFTAKDVYHFQLNDMGLDGLMSGIGETYGELIKTAANAFKQTNATKYKLKIDSGKVGDSQFQEDFNNYLKKEIETYIKSDCAVYPEFMGYELVEGGTGTSSGANAADLIQLRKDMTEMVANALHIPLSLMEGNITSVSDVTKLFLTFAVDPVADMIAETLNKRGGAENWKSGNFYKVNTGKIGHRDIFDLAVDVDKLLSTGVMCIDEIREEIGYERLREEWSTQHYITKNYEKIDGMDALKGGDEE